MQKHYNNGGNRLKELIYFESLGCDKNLVDSEVMLGMLQQEGYVLTMDPSEAEVAIINTCSFIHDAKEESVQKILELAEMKHETGLKGLVVVGCLTELYKEDVMKEIEEVDGVLGASNYDDILTLIEQVLDGNKTSIFTSIHHTPEPFIKRVTETTKHYAYLKIAEGCDNRCTYCIIPSLRGKFRSRELESLVEEATYLAMQGKRELILVAQDVGKYGMDLYDKRTIVELLQRLSDIEGIQWIRLLYVYPEDITDELITEMANNPKILHYIDMPLQHISDVILKKMARKSRKASIEETIQKLRKSMPDICIRTTFIVGFPGEGEEEYQELTSFVKKYRLDRVGVFTFSREEDAPAYHMKPQIEEDVKAQRLDQLMSMQQQISLENNQKLIGREVEVMIDGYIPSDDIYIGRTYRDTPDVDGYIFIPSDEPLLSGDFIKAKIVNVNEYDLIGEKKDEYSK